MAQYLYGICEYNYTTYKIEVFCGCWANSNSFRVTKKTKNKGDSLRKKKTGDCNFGVKKNNLFLDIVLSTFLVQSLEIEQKL